jgi:cytochrome bd-type quinol oxidase subunit 2
MNSIVKASVLIVISLLCLYGFAWLAFSKGVRVSEAVDNTVAVLVLLSAVLLPILAFLLLRGQRGSPSYRALLFPAFLVSLAPAVIILCAVLVALLVRRPE